MPADLQVPANVRRILPVEAQQLWMSTATACLKHDISGDATHKIAWERVKQDYEQRSGGKWIAKAGARHSRSDVAMLQTIHDHVVKLGASCSDDTSKAKASDMEVPDTNGEAYTKAEIVKVDEEQRMVYGWASVISIKGKPVVDSQGDVIDADELVKASTEFMADVRLAKAMHNGEGIGEVLHSFPLTTELAKSLGIVCDREGWIVGTKVLDDAVWARVKSGELRAFSIAGKSEFEELEAAA